MVRGLLARSALAIALATPVSTYAEEWQVVGARYEGLGGSGVALALDADATEWNPGNLALASERTEEVSIRGGVMAAAEGSFLDHAGDILDLIDATDIDQSIDRLHRGGSLDEKELQQALRLLVDEGPELAPDGQGAQAMADAAVTLRRGRFVLSGRGFGFVGVDPRFDLRSFAFGADGSLDIDQFVGNGGEHAGALSEGNLAFAEQLSQVRPELTPAQAQELVFQAERAGLDTSSATTRDRLLDLASSGGGSGRGARSGIFVRGLYVKQIGIAYGAPLVDGVLGVGIGLKYLHGTTVYEFVGVDASGSTDRDPHSPLRRSREWGLDLGLTYTPNPWLRIGLAGRNLNKPSFRTVGSHSEIALRPQLRTGFAAQLHPRLTLAADLDVTKNESETIDGVESRMLSTGLEYRTRFRRWVVDLRGGAKRNLARGMDDSVTFTLGFGLHVRSSRFDFAVTYGLGGRRIERVGAKLPRRTDLAGAFRWIREF